MLDYLLPELVSHVLNYTSQDDCLEFLRVCRRWHREVPVHAQHLWRQLNLTPSWGKTANDCLKMCLGPHVQRVSITGLEFDSYWILKKLAYLTCNITSLGNKVVATLKTRWSLLLFCIRNKRIPRIREQRCHRSSHQLYLTVQRHTHGAGHIWVFKRHIVGVPFEKLAQTNTPDVSIHRLVRAKKQFLELCQI